MSEFLNYIKDLFMPNNTKSLIGISSLKEETKVEYKRKTSKGKDVKLSDLMRKAS